MRSVTRLRLIPRAASLLLCSVVLACAAPPAAAPLGGSDPEAARVSSQPKRPSAEHAQPDTVPEKDTGATSETASKTAEPDALPSAHAAAPTGDGVSFKSFTSQVGDVVTMRLRMAMNGSMSTPVEGMDDIEIDLTGEYETKTEYLKVEDGRPVKYRIEYVADRKRGTMMGQDSGGASPLDGNTYVIDESGGGFVARRADGRKLTPEEESELKSNHTDEDEDGKSKDSDDEDYDFIPDRPLHVGETLPIPEKALKDLEENAALLSNIRLRFDGLREHDGVEVGVFTLVGNVDTELPQARVRAKPRGEMWVAVNGEYPTYMDFSASFDAKYGDEDMTMQGSGSVSIKGAMAYRVGGKP
jgi:hypothetical protein